MSYDPTTDVGKVRLLIADTDYTNLVFSEAEIGSFLTQTSSDLYLSAALACSALAMNSAKRAILIQREGYKSEYCRPSDLMKLAKHYIDLSNAIEGSMSEFPLTDEHFESFRPTWRDLLLQVLE